MFSSLAAFLVLVVFLRGLYLTVSRFWWRDAGRRPSVYYRKDSRLCPDIVRACTTLTHKYVYLYTSEERVCESKSCGVRWGRRVIGQEYVISLLTTH